MPVSPVTMATRPCTTIWSLIDAIFSAVRDHSGSAVGYADSVTSMRPGEPPADLRREARAAFAALLGEAVGQPAGGVPEHRAARGRVEHRRAREHLRADEDPGHQQHHGGGHQRQPRDRATAPGVRERVPDRVAVRRAGGEAVEALPDQRLGLVVAAGHSGAPVVRGAGWGASRRVARAREIWLRTVEVPHRRTAAISASE